MVAQAVSKERTLVNRKFPEIMNFPFDHEFDMEMVKVKLPSLMGDDFVPIGQYAEVVEFKYRASAIKASITMSPNEIQWVFDTCQSIKKLDGISKKLARGLKSKDILVKRDAAIEAENWMIGLTDGKQMLSKQILNDALQSIAGPMEMPETISLVTALNKILTCKGFVRITKREADIIVTFLQFKLIYTKLILGLVIASKTSIR